MRNISYLVRVSEADHELIRAAAAEQDSTLSAFVRLAALRAANGDIPLKSSRVQKRNAVIRVALSEVDRELLVRASSEINTNLSDFLYRAAYSMAFFERGERVSDAAVRSGLRKILGRSFSVTLNIAESADTNHIVSATWTGGWSAFRSAVVAAGIVDSVNPSKRVMIAIPDRWLSVSDSWVGWRQILQQIKFSIKQPQKVVPPFSLTNASQPYMTTGSFPAEGSCIVSHDHVARCLKDNIPIPSLIILDADHFLFRARAIVNDIGYGGIPLTSIVHQCRALGADKVAELVDKFIAIHNPQVLSSFPELLNKACNEWRKWKASSKNESQIANDVDLMIKEIEKANHLIGKQDILLWTSLGWFGARDVSSVAKRMDYVFKKVAGDNGGLMLFAAEPVFNIPNFTKKRLLFSIMLPNRIVLGMPDWSHDIEIATKNSFMKERPQKLSKKIMINDESIIGVPDPAWPVIYREQGKDEKSLWMTSRLAMLFDQSGMIKGDVAIVSSAVMTDHSFDMALAPFTSKVEYGKMKKPSIGLNAMEAEERNE